VGETYTFILNDFADLKALIPPGSDKRHIKFKAELTLFHTQSVIKPLHLTFL
jgi:hypothetical protein